MMSVRIAILVSHPIQHFAPWYAAFSALQGVTLKVFFCSKWGSDPYYDRDFRTEIRWDILLVHGYGKLTIWRTVAWCNRNRVPVMLYSDSNAMVQLPSWKRAAKAIVLS